MNEITIQQEKSQDPGIQTAAYEMIFSLHTNRNIDNNIHLQILTLKKYELYGGL